MSHLASTHPHAISGMPPLQAFARACLTDTTSPTNHSLFEAATTIFLGHILGIDRSFDLTAHISITAQELRLAGEGDGDGAQMMNWFADNFWNEEQISACGTGRASLYEYACSRLAAMSIDDVHRAKSVDRGMTTWQTAFETVEGFFGLGPRMMGPGDEVCVLSGSNVPVILRRQGDQYRFVGTCYTVGLMHGEVGDYLTGAGKSVIELEIV
jgi:hypothetical protein